MTRTLATLAALFLSSSLLPAQTLASASPFQAIQNPTNAGVSGLGYGFGVDAHRLQQLFNPDSFTTPVTQPIVVNSIQFRMPILYSTGVQGGQTIDLALELSQAPAGMTAATMTNAFPLNTHPATTKRVFRLKSVNLPILGTPTNPNTNFDFKLPVDPGGTYLYLPAQQRALVMDIYHCTFRSPTYNYYVDGYTHSRSTLPGPAPVSIVYGRLASAADFGTVAANGSYAGCLTSGGKTATHTVDPKALISGCPDLEFAGECFVGGRAGLLALGVRPTAIALPGGCQLANDLLLVAGFVSDPAGRAAVPAALPTDSALWGAAFLSQMIWVDPPANPLGVVTSPGLVDRVGKGFPTVGTLTVGRGLVTQFSNL